MAVDYDLTPIEVTHRMQAWQQRMGRMMQEQYAHERGSYQWNLIQANLDAISRATDMAPTTRPVTVRLII